MCPVDACSNKVNDTGRCEIHSRKPCLIERCATVAVAGGMCAKHRAQGKCGKPGCTADAVQKGRFCSMHGGSNGEGGTGTSGSGGSGPPPMMLPYMMRFPGNGVPLSSASSSGLGAASASTMVPYMMNFPRGGGIPVGGAAGSGAGAHPMMLPYLMSFMGGGVPVGSMGMPQLNRDNMGARATGNNTLVDMDRFILPAATRNVQDRERVRTCATAGCMTSLPRDTAQLFCRRHNSSSTSNVCIHKDCTTKAIGDGRCFKHGGNGTCNRPGCTSNARVRGLCFKHGGKIITKCTYSGCKTNAAARELCMKHGANGFCRVPGCGTNAAARGLCFKHGANGTCRLEGCTTNAAARGLCFKHGAHGPCHFEGCKSNARSAGRCIKHGGQTTKPCSTAGCTTNSVARGVCVKHGARGICAHEGCKRNARKQGVCAKHDPKGLNENASPAVLHSKGAAAAIGTAAPIVIKSEPNRDTANASAGVPPPPPTAPPLLPPPT